MIIRRVTFLLSFVLAVCAPLAVWAQKPACTTSNVQTSSGPVCGFTSNVSITGAGSYTASAYLGIPYGVPPTGNLRWQYSTPFQGSAPLQATAFANKCPQSLAPQPSTASSSQCTDGQSLGLGESEDCLYLNVWVPNGAPASSPLPVMVFIHGGAFVAGTGGSPTSDLFDGTYLAASGKVIVVTFNYRLGVLGFLGQGGNYNFGFADQLLALNWVRTNIASFGGAPNNVTLFGESAGAMSVALHAVSSPKSAGLFQAAIMESNPMGLPYKSAAQAQQIGNAFCSNPSLCTTATSACDLVEAQGTFASTQGLNLFTLPDLLMWAPAVDNVYVTGQPIAAAGNLGVPLILGTNHDEGSLFVYLHEDQSPRVPSINPPGTAAYLVLLSDLFGQANSQKIRQFPRYQCPLSTDCSIQIANVINDYAFTCANRHFAIQAIQGATPQPLYAYQFTEVSSFNFWTSPPLPPSMSVPQCAGLVCHGDELPYVFNTAAKLGQTFNPAEEALAQTIGGYWTSFANSRNPGATWSLFTPNKTYRLLNESSSTVSDPLDATANCTGLWDGIQYETSQALTSLLAALSSNKKKDSHYWSK